jgi:hypothetical protein
MIDSQPDPVAVAVSATWPVDLNCGQRSPTQIKVFVTRKHARRSVWDDVGQCSNA